MKDQPLRVTIENDKLIISIGIDTLAFADSERTKIKVTDPVEFSKEVMMELTREDETGATLVTDMLDKAMDEAVCGGSLYIEEFKS